MTSLRESVEALERRKAAMADLPTGELHATQSTSRDTFALLFSGFDLDSEEAFALSMAAAWSALESLAELSSDPVTTMRVLWMDGLATGLMHAQRTAE